MIIDDNHHNKWQQPLTHSTPGSSLTYHRSNPDSSSTYRLFVPSMTKSWMTKMIGPSLHCPSYPTPTPDEPIQAPVLDPEARLCATKLGPHQTFPKIQFIPHFFVYLTIEKREIQRGVEKGRQTLKGTYIYECQWNERLKLKLRNLHARVHPH